MTYEDVRISEIIAPVFYPLHKAIKTGEKNQFWIKGGRISTKSAFVSIEIILNIMRDKNANAVVVRKVGDTIRGSVMKSLDWATDMLNVSHLWQTTYSPAEMTYIPTGQKIIFRGLDKPTKLKSLKAARGYFKILWFEELEEFAGMPELRSVRQSVLRGGENYITFYTYNPPIDPHSWVNKEAELAETNPRVMLHHSTYEDVPRAWIENDIEEIEWLREHNPLAYEHEYMGIATGIHDSIIFAGKTSIQTFEPKPEWGVPYFGADWGFSQDPTCLIKCWIEEDQEKRKTLYIEHEVFAKNVDFDDIPELFDTIPDSRRYKIRADSARPDTISHVKQRGFNIVAVKKGKVEDEINVLKSFKRIVIHTRCKNMQEEARLYSYKIAPFTKDVTPDIVDKYNHGWDAVRYALEPFMKVRGKGTFAARSRA
jgi:phage terminase large subunit